MPLTPLPEIAIAAAVLLIAGVSKGVTGLGAPVIATPIIALLTGDLPSTIAVMVLPTVLSDLIALARVASSRRGVARMAPFIAGGVVGIVVGTAVLRLVDPRALQLLQSAVVLAFVAAPGVWAPPSVERLSRPRSGIAWGLGGGVLQGSVGASGPIVALYLIRAGLPRALFLFSINLIFVALDTTQLVALVAVQMLSGPLMIAALAATVPLLLGVVAGLRLQPFLDDRAFRRILRTVLFIVGCGLAIRAVLG